MKKTVCYTTKNGGDGSSSVVFFENQRSIRLVEEADPETWAGGEGGDSFQYDGEIFGLDIYTEYDVEQSILDADDDFYFELEHH